MKLLNRELKRHLLAAMTLLCGCVYGNAADNTSTSPAGSAPAASKGQRVGLVLSGGGAKGVAHIGVIKALEDNDIPIDYVTGTSAGAIVGSLYACGWNPEQMLHLFTQPDFHYWSTGIINPKEISLLTAPEPTPQWVEINLNLRDSTASKNIAGQLIPAHLVSPIPMNIEFLRLYAPYTKQCAENFNNLFVPFRCVCSDVYHKHKIVCHDGSLGDAVRASMSFPLVFKPIEMNGVLVYDGGIYDNFPVDVMREDFNPDFIIGVAVSKPDGKPKPNNIYSQLSDMIIQNNNYDLPAAEGVKIDVPVLQFGVLDFEQSQQIYEIGYRTGLAMVDSIKKRLPARRPLSEVTERRKSYAAKTPALTFDKVEVTGATPSQSHYLTTLFQPEPDEKIDINQVQDSYYRAVTSGKLENLWPQARFGEDGNNTLLLEASIKNPWKIGVGGWITTSTQSQLYIDLGYHTLSFNSLDVDLRGWVGQTYYAGMASAKFALRTNVPSMLRFDFVASRQKYYDSELLFYQSSTPSFITDNETFFRLGYSWSLGMPSIGYVRAAYGWLEDKYYSIGVTNYTNREKDRSRYRVAAFEVGYEYNTLNDIMYPNQGRNMKANLQLSHEGDRYIDGDIPRSEQSDAYDYRYRASAQVEWKQFFPLIKNLNLGASACGLLTLQHLNQHYTATLIHAASFAPTPSTRNYFNPAFRADNYLGMGVIPVWSPIQRLQLRGDFYGYVPIRKVVSGANDMAYHSGWFRNPQFIGELAAVYNFSFGSLALYGNYLSSPAGNWNFGGNLGVLLQAPRILR